MRKLFIALLLGASLLVSCNSEHEEIEGDKKLGILSFTSAIDTGTELILSRATSTDLKDYYVVIENEDGEENIFSYPAGGMLSLEPGLYFIRITSHTGQYEPDFDAPLYSGTAIAQVKAGETTPVNITCTQQNTGVFFVYDASLDGRYDNLIPSVSQFSADEFGQPINFVTLEYKDENRESTGFFLPPTGVLKISATNNGTPVAINGLSNDDLTVSARQIWKITLKAPAMTEGLELIAQIDPTTEAKEEEAEIGQPTVGYIPAGPFRNQLVSQGLVSVMNEATDEVLVFPKVKNYTSMRLDNLNYPNIKGIEYFTGLTSIYFKSMPALTEVDLSSNTKLTEVDCMSSAKLKKLDISNCNQLVKLNANYCRELATLQLPNTNTLEVLWLQAVPLTTLNTTPFTELKDLDATQSAISSLSLTTNSKLTSLKCSNTPISEISLGNLTALTKLSIWATQLESIDLSGCPNLKSLDLDGNKALKAIDLTGLSQLTTLSFSSSAVEAIDLSPCPDLTSLKCISNRITRLDLSLCPQLETIWSYGNPLTYVNISNLNKLGYSVWLFGQSGISSGTTINFSASPNAAVSSLETLVADNLTKYTTATLNSAATATPFTNLKEVSLQNCTLLKTINAKNMPALEKVYIYGSTAADTFNFEGSTAQTVTTQKTW